jgi:sirohydrochlorin ferrochelatase
MESLAAGLARALPDTPLGLGYLELAEPTAGEALEKLLTAAVTSVVVLPVLLGPAGHAKSDLPAVVSLARLDYPQVRFSYGREIGLNLELVGQAAAQIESVGGRSQPLLLVGRGTSDPEANADCYKLGRLLAEAIDSPRFAVGFAGTTTPQVTDALSELAQLGHREVVMYSWFLATGVLLKRIRDTAGRKATELGISLSDGGYLGPSEQVIEVLRQRYLEADNGPVANHCDSCLYRSPFPGLADRVGRPIGIGHSHLAHQHLHHHQH